jgi:hypothetical protein
MVGYLFIKEQPTKKEHILHSPNKFLEVLYSSLPLILKRSGLPHLRRVMGMFLDMRLEPKELINLYVQTNESHRSEELHKFLEEAGVFLSMDYASVAK